MANLTECDRCKKQQAIRRGSGIPAYIEICCLNPPFVVDLCQDCRKILRVTLTEFMNKQNWS